MEDDTESERFKPANDNIGPHRKPDAETWHKIDRVALTLGLHHRPPHGAKTSPRSPPQTTTELSPDELDGEADKD